MGNSHGTLAILRQLDPARLAVLITNADQRLDDPSYLPPSPENLKVILGKLAKQNFEARYDYAYEGNTSRPPNQAADPTAEITSIRGLCNITQESLGQIPDYVESLLSDIKIDWAQDAARIGIENQGRAIFSELGDSWRISPYTRKYDSPHGDEENSFQVDGMIIYSNVRISGQKCSVIYYVAVFYEVLSPLNQVKSDLLSILIRNASLLIDDESIPGEPSSQIEYLENILLIHGKKSFREQFGFPYRGDSTHPPDIAPGGSLSGVTTLCSTEERDALSALVDERIFRNINVPGWAKDASRTALQDTIAAIIRDPPLNAWHSITFEDVYNNPDTTQNSWKTLARLTYSRGSLTEGGITVQRWSVYYTGVYYDTPHQLVVIRTKFLSLLCNSANKLINEPDPCPPSPTVGHLSEIVGTFGKQKFNEIFSFPYNGYETNPVDMLEGTRVYPTSVIIEVWDNLTDNLEREVSNKIVLPNWVSEEARDRLVDFMTVFLNEPTYFEWDYRRLEARFRNAEGHEYVLRAILTYSTSTLSEAITVTATLIDYVGVFYRVKSGN